MSNTVRGGFSAMSNVSYKAPATPSPDLTAEVLRPSIGSRTLLVGTTGSGKSVLGKAMLDYLANCHIVIIDPKREFSFPGAKISHTPQQLASYWNRARVRIYRPSPEHLNNPDSWELVFGWIFQRRNTVLYIDELYQVCKTAMQFPKSLQSIYVMGRTLKITVIACVQRPAGIPLVCISESGRIALFDAAMQEDRDRVASCAEEAMQTKITDVPGATKHSFWWYVRGAGARAVPCQLNLPARKGK